MKRVYVCGPMTGLPEFNFPAFHAAAAALRAQGLEVVNPAEINLGQQGTWEQCMRAAIKGLCDCDGLVLLPGWQGSKGAHIELGIAHRLGMEIALYAAAYQPVAEVFGHPGYRTAFIPMVKFLNNSAGLLAEGVTLFARGVRAD